MAGLKISQLTKLEQMTGTEAIPVEKGGENYSMTPDVLLKDVKGGMAGLVTRLNDYAYDVSLLMGKMAVRGTKGASKTTQPYGSGYYHVDGSFTELGSSPYGGTVIVDENKVYHFDIGYHKYTNIADDAAVLVLFDENNKVLTAVPWAEGGFLNKYLVFTSEVKKYGVTYNISPAIKPYPSICNETYEIQDINDVISGLNTEISTIKSTVEALDPVTKDTFNDYMYDVSELMGKMAVRGAKGSSPKDDGENGYYRMDGSKAPYEMNFGRETVIVEENKVYHFDISYGDFSNLTDPATLVLFDKDDKVLTAIPLTESGFLNKYLVFTSEVRKYGVTINMVPIIEPYPSIYNENYEIEDVNDVLSDLSGKDSSMRDDFNNYISDVTNLFGKMAYRDGVGTNDKNVSQEDGYYDTRGKLKIQSAGFVYQKLQVYPSKIYRIRQMIGSYPAVSALVLFDEHDEIISTVPYNYPSASSDKYFVFAGVHSVGISFVKSDNNSRLESFDIQDLTTVINTQQGNRALYVAAGAVYNKQTGFYELNGLTDITEEQMRDIYVQTHHVTKQTAFIAALQGLQTIRTNYQLKVNGAFSSINCLAMFADDVDLEVAAFLADFDFRINNLNYLFRNCRKLHTVLGVLRCDYAQNSYIDTFLHCNKLVNLNLYGIKFSVSFPDSPLISLESLQYLITNAANTSPITVTVHADVYAKIQDETQTDWHALIEAAAAKQITFATV